MLVSVEIQNGDQMDGAFREALEKVSNLLHTAKRVVVITGAGISVSAGIPDFRSADGLYARVLSAPDLSSPSEGRTHSDVITVKSAKGKDFFDSSFFHNPATRPLFNRFVAELREMCAKGNVTPTHTFLKQLHDQGKLLRWYTQNIDGLEKATGLTTSTCISTATTVTTKKMPLAKSNLPHVVSLHGSLERLSCTLCKTTITYSESHQESFYKGESPPCEKCTAFSCDRQANGRRAVKCGILRPDIVLYNEPHPQGDLIAEYVHQDMVKRPTVLVVMGTSLKVVGLKKLVKDFSRVVHEQGEGNGLVIFVNKTMAPRSEWRTVFDYEFLGDCDEWVTLMQTMMDEKYSVIKKSIVDIHAEKPKKDGRIDQMFKVVRKSHVKSRDASKAKELPKEDENVKPIRNTKINVACVL